MGFLMAITTGPWLPVRHFGCCRKCARRHSGPGDSWLWWTRGARTDRHGLPPRGSDKNSPQAQPAVVPKLALRTETMRCLNESDQKGDPDRAQPGNLFEELTGGIGNQVAARSSQASLRTSWLPGASYEHDPRRLISRDSLDGTRASPQIKSAKDLRSL